MHIDFAGLYVLCENVLDLITKDGKQPFHLEKGCYLLIVSNYNELTITYLTPNKEFKCVFVLSEETFFESIYLNRKVRTVFDKKTLRKTELIQR